MPPLEVGVFSFLALSASAVGCVGLQSPKTKSVHMLLAP
jgi:hypothetical protein